jgi:hypothetical protein
MYVVYVTLSFRLVLSLSLLRYVLGVDLYLIRIITNRSITMASPGFSVSRRRCTSFQPSMFLFLFLFIVLFTVFLHVPRRIFEMGYF